jgi:hypothetical protein
LIVPDDPMATKIAFSGDHVTLFHLHDAFTAVRGVVGMFQL